MKLKKGDNIIVLAGKDKGKKGQIIKILPKENKAVVDGVNISKKHKKGFGENKGEVLEIAMPIDISNLSFFDEDKKSPSRIGYKTEGEKKVRISKKSAKVLK